MDPPSTLPVLPYFKDRGLPSASLTALALSARGLDNCLFPTAPLTIYNSRAERILPRSGLDATYRGRCRGRQGTTNRLRLVSAYLLSKIGQDHSSWFRKIKPENPPPTPIGGRTKSQQTITKCQMICWHFIRTCCCHLVFCLFLAICPGRPNKLHDH